MIAPFIKGIVEDLYQLMIALPLCEDVIERTSQERKGKEETENQLILEEPHLIVDYSVTLQRYCLFSFAKFN